MEFSIDINTTCDGHVTVLDLARDFHEYLEDDEVTHERYKYELSATINSIVKVNLNSISLSEVLMNDHTSPLDQSTFKINEDGYYVVTHIVLPTITWLEQLTEEYLEYYRTIYVTDGKKVYKAIGYELEECTLKEILEVNSEETTLFKVKIDVVYTGNLQNCYFDYCQRLFNSILNKCDVLDKNLTFGRDYIWMTLNIIDYLVCNKLYMEIQRIIETFNTCNGLCKQYTNKLKSCCGRA